jgi:hypothetical protein
MTDTQSNSTNESSTSGESQLASVELEEQTSVDWGKLDEELGMVDAQPEPEPTQEPAEQEQPESEQEAEPEQFSIYDHVVKLGDQGDSEEVTVGQLKDVYQDARAQRNRYEKERAELATERALISEMLKTGKPMDQESIGRLETARQERMAQEHQAVLQAIPEWSDPETFKTDRQEIVKYVSRYGFSEAEVAAIDQSRLVRLLHRYAQLEARAEKGAKAVKAIKRKQPEGKTPSNQRRPRSLDKLLDPSAHSGPEPNWSEIDQYL